jgi:hypothetical protein
VADTGVMDLDADFMGLRGRDLDILVAERLTGAPGDGSLANDGLMVVVKDGVSRGCLQRLDEATSSDGRSAAARRLSPFPPCPTSRMR